MEDRSRVAAADRPPAWEGGHVTGSVPTEMLTSRELVAKFFEMKLSPVFWRMNGDSKGPHETEWPAKAVAGYYTIDKYHDGDRVGLVTGTEVAPGQFVHDVDIDWGPGVEIAKLLLPPTGFVYGRARKRVSHCFYTMSEALPSVEYRDIDSTMLIELRGTTLDGSIGKQSMAPPSIWTK